MPWINKDYKGQKFGKWEILERDLTKKRPIKYFCKCECGTIKSNHIQNILRGLSTQCTKCQSFKKSQELVGKKINSITILSLEKVNGITKAKIKCDCGNERYLSPSFIKKSVYTNCGQYPLKYAEGSKFGLLTIKKRFSSNDFTVKCDCGNEKKVKFHHITNQFPSCGCYWKNKRIENAKKLIGYKHGYLKFIAFLGMKGPPKKTRAWYSLKCKCGNILEREIGDIFSIYSCGCLQKERVFRGSKSSVSKTNEVEVSAIRELFNSGLYSRKELADMTHIKYTNICEIIKGSTWKHI